ncbi:MAG TPA: sulfotransferase [Solirubrobacteraceae bacterium]|nr:sulfotransferase [Solirubrobacteraceae bacterium]
MSDGSTGDAAAAPRPRLPDFFIVGHQKCGTTALYEMLRAHPQIFLPDVKEPRYFTPDDPRRRRGAPAASRARTRTLEAYLALFADATAQQLVGEASPQYLRLPDAAQRIAELCPDARIIAILREPVAFLRSFHLQMLTNNAENQKDLRKAVALEERRRQGKRIPRSCWQPATLMYSEHVRYVEQLRSFEACFSRERMLVLIYDDYRRDNQQIIHAVERFLGVDEGPSIPSIDTAPNRDVRFAALHRLAWGARRARLNPASARPLGRAVNALTPAPLRGDAFRARWRQLVYREPRPPDERFQRELRRRFKPEVVALSEYLDRDLVALWGYDAID